MKLAALLFGIAAIIAGVVITPPCDFWCMLGFTGRTPFTRAMPRIGDYYLPRGAGVIAQGYDMAIAPYPWWQASNIMPNYAMLDDIASHDIRLANIWVRVNPFDGTARWCNEQWYPFSGYVGTEMCRGNGTVVDEDMDLFWNHPDFDVLVIRFEAWASTEEGCNGGESLVWESEPTKGIVDTLYERYSDQDKIVIFQNWEADWQLYGVRCTELNMSRASRLLRILHHRQEVISQARQAYPRARLRVYHAVNINFYSDEEYTVTKDIIPQMDDLPDFVGVSYWRKPPFSITDALDYVEENTGLPRYRIYVSELGAPERDDLPQYDRIMREGTLAFEWGVPMVLVWHWKYWGSDDRQKKLSLFKPDNTTPQSGYWAVKELNDEWR